MPLPAVDTNRDSAVSRDRRLDGLSFDPIWRVAYPAERHRGLDEGERDCSILCTVVIFSPDPGASRKGPGPGIFALLFRSVFRQMDVTRGHRELSLLPLPLKF